MARRHLPRYLSVPDLRPYESPRYVPLPLGLLDDYRLNGLSDTARWHYIGICLLAASCGNRLRSDAEWIARRLHATEPVDLLGLFEAKLLAASRRPGNSREEPGRGGEAAGIFPENSRRFGEISEKIGKKRDISGKKWVTSACNSPPALTAAPPYSKAKQSRAKQRKEKQQQQQRARAREGGGCGGGRCGSRHDTETLRRYAATRPNARSVRELARYFARTGAADDEVDEWLAERKAAEEAARGRRQAEAEEERLRHQAVVAEILARGGPGDEIERAFCESLGPSGASQSRDGGGGGDG